METLFVLDASGYLYRSYHAIQHLTNDKGESTNALYGFIRSILKLSKDFHPTHLVAVFDGPRGIEKRKELYAEYKAHRVAMPEDLRYQIGWAQEFCDLWGIPKLVVPGVEADDTMGSVAGWAAQKGAKVYLCTSDKDMCQLVNDHVFILNTHKENLILDQHGVKENFGVRPSQMIDYLAIVGDASDNVPGIAGFGPKTAAKLLEEMGDLDTILAHPERISGKKKETIESSKEIALLSRQLVTIDTNVAFTKDAAFFALAPPKTEELKTFFKAMKFSSLLKEMETSMPTPEQPFTHHIVDDPSSLKNLFELLSQQKEICITTETTNRHPLKAELAGIGFGIKPGEAWYVPLNGSLGKEPVLNALKPLFENSAIGFIAHNAKDTLHVLANHGLTLKKISFDTILASYVLTSESRQHSLDALSLECFGKVKIPLNDLLGKGKNQLAMHLAPIEKVAEYCCENVECTLRLKERFEKELIKRKLEAVLFNLELPLQLVLFHMERRGIFLDIDSLKGLEDEVKTSLERIEKEIHLMAGEEFNLKSPQQLSKILFEKLGLPAPKKTTTGHSTSADVLESLQGVHPIAAKMMEYRTLEKLRSSYIDTLPHEILPRTGRIHPTFNQASTATGRLSCQDPNLQQIPIRTETGRRIREAFRPQKQGWSFLGADYSQIELRLLAHFSEDPTLLSAFHNNEDIHTHTAATILNIPLDQVTPEQRSGAKAVNFGIIYGQQAFGLSRELNISIEEASKFIKTYFERYKRVREFVESCKEAVRKTGKAVTLFGRERALPEITSKNLMIRAVAERLAVNTPLQGTAADLIKKAMISIDKRLNREQQLGFLILQVHDELIFEIPDFEILHYEPLVKEEMERVHQLKVPLRVDLSVGKNWKEC